MVLLLWKTQVQFPEPISSVSQSPANSNSRVSDLYDICTYPLIDTYFIIKNNNLKV